MIQFSSETLQFIREHRTDNVRDLALRASRYPGIDVQAAAEQIAGWQVARKKLPGWAQTEGIVYPKHLSMEQCSSDITARYKASLVRGFSFTDRRYGPNQICCWSRRIYYRIFKMVWFNCG